MVLMAMGRALQWSHGAITESSSSNRSDFYLHYSHSTSWTITGTASWYSEGSTHGWVFQLVGRCESTANSVAARWERALCWRPSSNCRDEWICCFPSIENLEIDAIGELSQARSSCFLSFAGLPYPASLSSGGRAFGWSVSQQDVTQCCPHHQPQCQNEKRPRAFPV